MMQLNLYRVLSLIGLAGWDVESDLHERNLSVVVLVELQCDFVLPCGTLGNIGERDLKRRVVVDVERQQGSWGKSEAPGVPLNSNNNF